MRILIAGVTYFPVVNGQAIFTVNLAEGLAQHGHEVLMVIPSDRGHPYQDEHNGVQIEGVRSTNLSAWHENSYVSLFSAEAVSRIFERFKPDVVHIQDHYPLCSTVAREAQKRGIKRVGTNHFMPENFIPYVPKFLRVKSVYNWALWHWVLGVYNRVDVAAAQSRVAAGLIRAQGLRPPVYPVSCGIDLERFHPDPDADWRACRLRYGLDPERIVFLFVGRVDWEKGVDVLLHAMQQLDYPQIQLGIAGKGAAFDEFKQLANSLDLGDRVRFTGFISNDDLPTLLNSVDIFTMPSEAELLSIASLEAMACARPVLLADAVALPELVTPGVNGYLFRPGDPADAARYMKLLADQRECWPEMGRAGLERAQLHSLENTVRRYEMLYEALLSNSLLPDFQHWKEAVIEH